MNSEHNKGNLIKDLEAILDEALAALSDSDRDAIVLRFYQNKSFKAIARLLGKETAVFLPTGTG